MSKLSKLQLVLLTDEEVRLASAKLKQLMGEPISGLLQQYGISPEDHFQFHPLAVRLEGARIERGLSLKAVAAALKVPKYRLTETEASRTKSIDPEVLIRYAFESGRSLSTAQRERSRPKQERRRFARRYHRQLHRAHLPLA